MLWRFLTGTDEKPSTAIAPADISQQANTASTAPDLTSEDGSIPTVAVEEDDTPLITELLSPILDGRDPEPENWTVSSQRAVHPSIGNTIVGLENFLAAEEQAEPDLTIEIGDKNQIGTWVYAAVMPFRSTRDDVGMGELKERWLSNENRLVVTGEAFNALHGLWGDPGAGMQMVSPIDIAGWLWRNDDTMGVVEFQELNPVLKALRVDGFSPLQRNLDLTKYPLAQPVSIEGNRSAIGDFFAQWDQQPFTNRDESRMTRVAMTGVTALVRATAYEMEQRGVLYPGEEIAALMRNDDIAHISNEVPFVADCPFPDRNGGTTFCSADKYFELLTNIGTDVVEVTGNHVNDYGPAEFSRTLDFYTANGMSYFGGGKNSADAREPALFDHNGNKIAFIGCNPVGPVYAWATQDEAGSRPCDDSVFAQITALRADGWLPIVTLQYTEYYEYDAPGVQVSDFWRYAEAGAVGVSGSQGHHVQGFSFHNGAFIHYGLGNLFFDQMDQMGTRQALIDHYVFYNGQLVSIEITTALIENFARPRIMEANERRQILDVLFTVSDWP